MIRIEEANEEMMTSAGPGQQQRAINTKSNDRVKWCSVSNNRSAGTPGAAAERSFTHNFFNQSIVKERKKLITKEERYLKVAIIDSSQPTIDG